jgi:pyridoxamine 5'-phosphate oxidase
MAGIDIADLDPDPIRQFQRWHAEAGTDVVALATASPDGDPSARMMLIKGADGRGFVFHSNYGSVKGRALAANPRAALVFFWPPDRQVRVTGPVERLPREESEAYWRTRPRASQLGAWASRQSEPIASRAVLERRLAEVQAEFDGREVPSPPFWGGFRLVPEAIEFWHHREDRLHDRIRYRRDAPGGWLVERVSP